MLDYLHTHRKTPKGLDTLVESIRREKTQNFLIQKITDEVLKLRNIKLEHLKGKQRARRRVQGGEESAGRGGECRAGRAGEHSTLQNYHHLVSKA